MPDRYTYRKGSQGPPAGNGPLSGKRVVIQPNISVRGWPCSAGSRALAGFTALQDATVVTRLAGAGAELAGSARMSELGFGLAGDTAAGCIAGREADLALVTDTMGEARLAAAGAGLFGFKPSYGLVSRFGLIGLVPSMECCGIVAAHPSHIAETLSALAGPDPNDPSMPDDSATGGHADPTPPKGPCTAGVIKECLERLDETERDAFRAGLARLAEAGVTIREVSLPDYPLIRDVHNVIASVEASSSAGKYDGVRYGHRCPSGKNWNDMYLNSRGESFGPLVKPFLFQGAYFQFENYPAFENACRIRGRLVRAAVDLLGQVDLLVSPTRRPAHDPARAATIDATYEAFLLTLPANVTGQPALQLPALAVGDGADVGVQLTGLRLDDARLLSIGTRLSSKAREGR
jgi:aspartyl-tRNA(Asn)/glutamyl-tRNA(Gln) amidotransferase subunit A